MVNTLKSPTQKSKILPVWLMRLIGISSLATAVIGFAIYWFRKYPPRRKINSPREANNAGNTESSSANEHGPVSIQQSTESWSSKFLNKVRKNKKKMTISLKNTVLWNPSPDVDTPIYAFQENSIQFLTRLSYIYDIYLIIHVNTEEEKEKIANLLENATNLNAHMDPRKIIYCSSEEGKIHIIRHIEPFIHVEGGWEKDDGEEIIKKVKPFVNKLIWIITKKRRNSFMPENIKSEDHGLIANNIELSDLLIDTSIAREVKD